MAVFPIPTTRISGLLVQRRLLSQLSTTNIDVLKLQSQLGSGRRLGVPSDDPAAATQGIRLQRVLEQKEQSQVNIQTTNTFLAAADTILSSVSQSLIDVRGLAVSMSDSTTTSSQREAAVIEINRAIDKLVSEGNTAFRGRHLFAGANGGQEPFEADGKFVTYHGNEGSLQSYVDLDILLDTNISGNGVFGAFSAEVQGTGDLNPILTEQTRLVDLHDGKGVKQGSIFISDGASQVAVDLTNAETLGDIKRLIEANPPPGRTLLVDVGDTGLIVDLDGAGGGSLTISEVEGGTTAAELGILELSGAGTAPLIGSDLRPRLNLTTNLNDILGTKARGSLVFAAEATLNGFDNFGTQIDVKAAAPGVSLAEVKIRFQAVNGLGFGNETAIYNPGNKTLTLQIDDAVATSSTNVAAAITAEGTFTANASGVGSIDGSLARDLGVTAVTEANVLQVASVNPGTDLNNVNISIATQAGLGETPVAVYDNIADTLIISIDDATPTSLDKIAAAVDGLAEFSAIARPNVEGTVAPDPADVAASVTTVGGTGVDLDQTSGIQIINGETTHTVNFAGAETVSDLLNVLTNSDADLLAEINDTGNGINVRSRVSGANFHIGENGGTTAAELGIRSFTQNTKLSTLNFGRGVESIAGTDFTIRRNDGFDLQVDISTAATVGDVVDLINNHVDNQNPATQVTARLAQVGNGIELVDPTPGVGVLTVIKEFSSNAARDLGLIPTDQDQASTPNPGLDPEVLTGRDVNPLETHGVFNSLRRLADAIQNFNIPEIERATALLDMDIDRVNFARAEIGVRGQTLDRLSGRIDAEQVQLQETLSLEIDVDFVEAATNLTAQQATLQASLQLIGTTFQLSLLDFL